ncbi:MAG: Xaa-Pro peptidase family protein [bacterium]|nr:Xaa-Pro peptidase family protein [bacterium]
MIKERIAKLRSFMDKCYCFLLSSVPSIYYFTGFNTYEGDALVLIPCEGKGIIVSDLRYKTQIKEEADPALFDVLMTRPEFKESYLERLEAENLFLGSRFRVEDRYFNMNQYLEIQRLWPNIEILPCSLLMLNIRSVKDEGEISLIKKAIEITEKALSETLSLIKVGTTEKDIAAEISYRQRKLGASADAFSLIVLSGERSALIHGEPGEKKIEAGDILQFDIGAVYKGYHSDLSRVVIVGGQPTSKQCEIHGFVRMIQEAMIEKIKPGVNFKELNLEHEKLLKGAGFEVWHGLGHGVGLEIHEWPNVAMQDFIAKTGNVVTVEPGIYIPGWGGVRIEDMVLVTETGHEILTSFSKELLVLGV